jgi:hypothetical protein
MSWNHYLGFYYQNIIDFFMMSIPFPFKEEELWLEVVPEKVALESTQIVSHIFHQYWKNHE